MSAHPRGIYLVAVVEFWERFSYFGMRALLVLFLTTSVAQGGLGWSFGAALQLYGIYTAATFVTPILGGYLGDRVWGPKRALIVGSVVSVLGHLLLACHAALPSLVSDTAGIAAVGIGSTDVETAGTADRLSLGIFVAALALIAFGAGFFKSNAYAFVDRLYEDRPEQREAGFIVYYMSVNLGAIGAGFVVGSVGERIGWHAGFATAGFGMLAGLLLLVGLQGRWLAGIGDRPAPRIPAASDTFSDRQVNRGAIKVIAVLALFAIVFAMLMEQSGGLLNLYAAHETDRAIGGWEVPATWFQALNPMFVLILSPVVAAAVVLMNRGSSRLSIMSRYAIALAIWAIGFGIMIAAACESAGPDRASPLYLVGAYLFATAGEILFVPVSASMVTRIAPRGATALTFSWWLLAIGMGHYLAGFVGSLVETVSIVAIFTGLSLTALAAAAIARLLNRRINVWSAQAGVT